MKLIYKQDYLSIKKFEPIVLNNFSILTGLNGSGKTHLLNSIISGAVEIEFIDKSEVVYYNYNDFTVYTMIEDPKSDKKYQNKINITQSSINEFIQKLNEKIQNIINQNKNLSAADKSIISFLHQPNFDFEIYFSNKKDYENLESIKDKIEHPNQINLYRNLFTGNFFNFINNYLVYGNGKINEINYNLLKNRFKKLTDELEKEFKISYPDLYEYFETNISTKSIITLNQQDIESPNFFLLDLENEEKNYQYLKTINSLNKVYNTEFGDETQYFEKEKFIIKYGKSPIELINEVLNEYDCNGYYLTTNNFHYPVGIDREKINISILLKHKENDYVTYFDNLSSGEKTLMTLALFIYKSNKNRIIPRVLLLDEIDSCLHPSMIIRLLNVINKLFVIKKGIKVILVTHSPTTIALAPEDSIYIMHKTGEKRITKEEISDAINFLTEGFATIDKGLKLFDSISQKKVSIITEGDNVSFLQKANTYFGNNEIEIIKGAESQSGKDQLKTLFNFFTKVNHDKHVFFVWDCDVTYKLIDANNTYHYIFKQNETNKVKKGIENLFPKEIFKEDFYKTKPKEDGGTQCSLDKNKFKEYVVANGTREDYINFKPLFDFINKKVPSLNLVCN